MDSMIVLLARTAACALIVHQAHLLGGADGAGAHSHTQRIGTGLDQPLCLPARDHIAADDLQVGVRPLEMCQHLQLVCGVACAPSTINP